jgi:hypothetical protein
MESINVTYKPEDIQQSLFCTTKKLGGCYSIMTVSDKVVDVYRLLVADIRQKQLSCLGVILQFAN